MIPGGTIAVLLAALAHLPWADADTVNVQDGGAVDLAPYACTDITRSSVIGRVCYDAPKQRAILQVRSIYRQYCGVSQVTLEALLNAPSMGQFYRARIEDPSAHENHYNCPAWPVEAAGSN